VPAALANNRVNSRSGFFNGRRVDWAELLLEMDKSAGGEEYIVFIPFLNFLATEAPLVCKILYIIFDKILHKWHVNHI
jgi:hypothetical protein